MGRNHNEECIEKSSVTTERSTGKHLRDLVQTIESKEGDVNNYNQLKICEITVDILQDIYRERAVFGSDINVPYWYTKVDFHRNILRVDMNKATWNDKEKEKKPFHKAIVPIIYEGQLMYYHIIL